MKTEEMQRTQRGGDPFGVSRALQELTPRACTVVDQRGRPVPLSSAGFVLRIGKSYRLQIISPFADDQIQELRIINAPSFIKTESEIIERDSQGRLVRCLPFKVSHDLWDLWAKARTFGLGIDADELEVVHLFKPGTGLDAPIFHCPVVVRPSWETFGLALVLALILLLFQNLISGAFHAASLAERAALVMEPFLQIHTWMWLGGTVAVIWLIVTSVNLWLLYRRSRELCEEFHASHLS